MRMKLVADGEGHIWGGLFQESDAQWFSPSLDQWSPYKDLPGPLAGYDPMREVPAAFSRGKLTQPVERFKGVCDEQCPTQLKQLPTSVCSTRR